MAAKKTFLFFVLIVCVWSNSAEQSINYDDLVAKVNALSGLVGEVAALKQSKEDLVGEVAALKERLRGGVDRQLDPNKLHKMPTSCADVAALGLLYSGFHVVKGTNSLNFVYCDFLKTPGTSGYETFIGSADVKSTPVQFFAQKNQNTYPNVNLTYNSVPLNVGGAFNGTTGQFTAPKSGTYFFAFTGMGSTVIYGYGTNNQAFFKIKFWKMRNSKSEYIGSANCDLSYSSSKSCPFSYQFTVSLNAGDIIYANTTGLECILLDGSENFSSFNGILIEEDISKVLTIA